MSKVDEELTLRFQRAERRVEHDGLFEGLARRRRRRRTLQRLEAGALAIAVLVATAGGFVALQRAFDEDGRDAGTSLPGNGEIAFVREGEDGRLHIYASQPDGSSLRQLTEGDSNDSDTAVSPDGRTVAFARGIDGFGRATIATVPIEGGPITWQTAERYDVTDPAWSPDGSQIAFIGHTADARADLYVAEVGTDAVRRIPIVAEEPAHPTWSSDGDRIAVAAYRDTDGPSPSADLGVIRSDGGGGLEWLTASTDADEQAPAWSPDGSRIAFLRQGDRGYEVWTMSAAGGSETLVATAIEASLILDLDWAPDGSALLVSDGEWIYRADATPEGDPRDNFVQMLRGFSPSWQPLLAGSDPSVTVSPAPSPSPSPEPEGKDVGLGFNLCNVERLGGIDFLGDGMAGVAWVGVPTNDDGTCPSYPRPGTYIIAEDHTADGVADSWVDMPAHCDVLCAPFDATDLDGNGSEELIVASYFSIMSYYVLGVRSNADGDLVIRPFRVAEPGHEPAGLIAGEPLRIDAGGDEGYGSEIVCEPPVIVWTWMFRPVESNQPAEVHYVELELWPDGMFHVVGTNDYMLPVGEPTPLDSTEPSCGVDWHPSP